MAKRETGDENLYVVCFGFCPLGTWYRRNRRFIEQVGLRRTLSRMGDRRTENEDDVGGDDKSGQTESDRPDMRAQRSLGTC